MAEKQIVIEVSGGVTLRGEADLGRATSDKKWKITKTEVAGGTTTIKFPVGANGYPSDSDEFSWDERASLNFSFTPDTTAPTLTTVTIASDNSDTAKAKVGDTVTVTIVGSEYLKDVAATINGNAATVTEGVDDKHFTASYVMASGDTEGAVTFSVSFKDISGRSGTPVTSVTDASSVTFDKTAPTLVSAAKDLVTQITVTISELAKASTITKANAGGFSVFETGTPGTTYAVSAIAPGATNDLVVLTVADMTASALAGVTVAYTAGGNGTVSDTSGNLLATDATGVVVAPW